MSISRTETRSIFRLTPILSCLAVSCAAFNTAQGPPLPSPTPGSFHLFAEVAGIPSEILAARSPREDLEIRTTTGSPTPAEIASTETPPLVLAHGMRVSLAGDEAGLEGWSVNNLVLFEVLVDGAVESRFGVGMFEPLYMGSEMIDAVGGYTPLFDPRTPNITHRLPVGVPFVLRATALDYRALGQISSLWLLIETASKVDHGDLRDD